MNVVKLQKKRKEKTAVSFEEGLSFAVTIGITVVLPTSRDYSMPLTTSRRSSPRSPLTKSTQFHTQSYLPSVHSRYRYLARAHWLYCPAGFGRGGQNRRIRDRRRECDPGDTLHVFMSNDDFPSQAAKLDTRVV